METIRVATSNSHPAKIHVEIAGALIGITDVHLDWRDPDP